MFQFLKNHPQGGKYQLRAYSMFYGYFIYDFHVRIKLKESKIVEVLRV